MIEIMRIDERLIHGQVVIGWSKRYDISHIVVANDRASKDTILQKTLKMAAPAGMKVAIKTVKDAIELLKDPKGKNAKIMVLIDNPKDAYEIAKEIKEIPLINIGNYGRLGATEAKRVNLATGVYVNEEDKSWLKKLNEINNNCIIQMTSDQNAVSLNSLL